MSILSRENRLVFSQGRYCAARSRPQPLPAGVTLEMGEDVFLLSVPDKAVVEDTMHLVFLAGDEDPKPRTLTLKVRAGVSTRLNVVIHRKGQGAASPMHIKTVFFLSENSCVDLYEIEEPGMPGGCVTSHLFHLKKHASMDYFVYSFGDGVSLNVTTVDLQEEHGFFSAKGLSVLRGRARATHRLNVDHRAPHCISRQYYKNIVADHAQAEYESRVKVFEGASRSDSQQLNKNLLLSDTAKAHAMPQLQIDNDDVIATHGSASGQLEDDELFYLQSRGFSREAARLVLLDGFAGELLTDVHEKELKGYLENAIGRQVHAVAGSVK